jgi:hypothetical protein
LVLQLVMTLMSDAGYVYVPIMYKFMIIH